MNNLLTFFLAPLTAFFYPPVYKDAAKSSAWRGILYGLYLAVLSTVFLTLLFVLRVAPEVDGFAKWVQGDLPTVIWTPAGLSLENGKTTATMTHPKYGKMVLFDMTKKTATEADFGDARILVGPTKIFARQNDGRVEARDITGAAMRRRQQLPPKIRIDGALAGKLYQNIKGILMFTTGFVSLLIMFPALILLNLFYSLAGLLMNFARKEKARYRVIFNLTCFATSTSFTVMWVTAINPDLAFSYSYGLNVLINLIFMFFAFKVTDRKPDAV